jgi:hypothetical protein
MAEEEKDSSEGKLRGTRTVSEMGWRTWKLERKRDMNLLVETKEPGTFVRLLPILRTDHRMACRLP